MLSFTVNLGVTVVLHEVFSAPAELAYAVALVLVLTLNFVTCRHIVFRAAAGSAARQGVLFVVSSIVFRLIEYSLFLVVHTMFGVWYVAAVLGVSVPMVLVKFLFHGSFVFVDGAKR